MTKDSAITADYPVVLYRRNGAPGWYYRGEGEDQMDGPFADRDSAIAHALKDMSEKVAGRPEKPGVRRAA